MERAGPVSETWEMDNLTLLCRQAIKDIERVTEAVDELELMFSDCPAYVRPLVHRGFRARMGIGVRDWRRFTEGMLESHRDLEKAVLRQDEETLMDQAQAFLDGYGTAMHVLNQLYVNLNGLVGDSRDYLMENEDGRVVEDMVERQTDTLAALITTLEQLRLSLARLVSRME